MNKLILVFFIAILSSSFFVKCKKDLGNSSPNIKFTQPNANISIAKDTNIVFVAEAVDANDIIKKVEFYVDGVLISTSETSPYTFSWQINAIKMSGEHKVKAIAYDNLNAMGICELNITVINYLDQWVGTYQGVSEHWSSYPAQVNGQWQFINNSTIKNVIVNVSKNSSDSTLDILVTYENTTPQNNTNLYFNDLGVYNKSWGGGSSYGSLNFTFHSDSLKEVYFQKCGIPCNSGINYNIKKTN